MDNALLAFAMIETLHKHGDDYIELFIPFLLSSLDQKSSMTFEEVQAHINDSFGLLIPIHALTSISTHAKRQLLVNQTNHRLTLTEAGYKRVQGSESPADSQRRINELLNNAICYFQDNGMNVSSTEEANQMIVSFIKKNVKQIGQYIAPDITRLDSSNHLEIITQCDRLVIDYIIQIENQSPQLFDVLRDIIRGSILSLLVYSAPNQERPHHFLRTAVYLDTNILLSLLNLHHDDINRSANELLTMMKDDGSFDFRVFDFTRNEIASVLSQYSEHERHFISGFRVNSIYSSLKDKGWTSLSTSIYCSHIDDYITNLGIQIIKTGLDYNDCNITQEERDRLLTYKPDDTKRNLNHDLLAICQVAKLREGRVRQLEKAKIIFLTSDGKLAKYTLERRHHVEGNTISEVILDKVLANTLWLQTPNKGVDIPLKTIISMNSHQLFLDKRVWSDFVYTLNNLKETNKISNEDISLLLYNQSVRDTLKHMQAFETETGEPWVLDQVEHIREEAKTKNERSEIERDHVLKNSEELQERIDELLAVNNESRTREIIAIEQQQREALSRMQQIEAVMKKNRHLGHQFISIFKWLTRITLLLAVLWYVYQWYIQAKTALDTYNIGGAVWSLLLGLGSLKLPWDNWEMMMYNRLNYVYGIREEEQT
ncbi:MAG: hypothetical protein ACYC1M_07900 [Armatimonadota bacterium]